MMVKISFFSRKKSLAFSFLSKAIRAVWLCVILFSAVLFPATQAFSQNYPNVDISGYKKYEYRQIGVTPTYNYFLGQQHLGTGYGYISGPWQERLQLRILGRLSERLSVSYDLEQQPEMPERYQVRVNYDNHELLFGEFNASFMHNEFATTTKSLNGVLFTSYDNWYNLTFVPSTKIRSYTQPLTTQYGNNTPGPYNLGHTNIIEGSEYVELEGTPLKRDAPDGYVIDYFEGKITFKRSINNLEQFKYSYEYTNIIDLFFPAASRRDFLGYEGKYTFDPTEWGKPTPKEEPIIRLHTETFPSHILAPKIITEEVLVIPEVKTASVTEGAITGGVVLVNDKIVLTFLDIPGQLPGYERAKIIGGRIASVINVPPSPEAIDKRTFIVEESARIDALIALGSIEGDYVCLAGDNVLFTVDNREASIWGIPPEELAESWIETLKRALKPEVIIESTELPIEVEQLSAEFEEEEVGTYKLAHHPIVMFSESIVFEGSALRKDLDYSINYETGTLKLLTPILPTPYNKMTIRYRYYLLEEADEVISGKGSRGPYEFKHDNVIPGSERIVVSEMPNLRGLDYEIDYKKGKITFFYKVLTTQTINVSYRYVAKRIPPPPEDEGPEHKLTITTTYLRESAKKGEGLPTQPGYEVFSGSTVLGLNNTIYLEHLPIDASSIVLTRNGSELVQGIDYAVPSTEVVGGNAVVVTPPCRIAFREPLNNELRYLNDPLDFSDGEDTGTITFLTTIESDDSITVSYTYFEGVFATSRFYANVNDKGPYWLTGVRGMIPGSETIKVWDGTKYIFYNPNPSTTETTTFGNGYNINYADPAGASVKLNDSLTTETTFIVDYWYVPESSPTGSDIAHDVMGVGASYKIGNILQVESTVAKSSTDKVYGAMTTVETFNGDGGRIYNLNYTNIVEDSEKVFINNDLKNKDVFYSISYASGLLTFYQNISTAETIRIEYDYEDPSIGDIRKKEGYAYKFAASGKIGDNFDVRGSFKKVEVDFTPMGGLPLALGSDQRDAGFNYRASDYVELSASYKQTNDLVTQAYDDKYIHRDEWNLATKTNIYDVFDLNLGFRQTSSLDDELPENLGVHNHDAKSDYWTLGINPKPIKSGEIAYTNKNDLRKTLSLTDTVDRIAPTTTNISYLRTIHSFNFSDWADFSVDYQVDEPLKTRTTTEAGSTKEVETEHIISRNVAYTTNMNLTKFLEGRVHKLSTMARFSTLDKEDLINDNLVHTRNQTLRLDFNPIKEVTTSYRNDREETPSSLIENLGNPGYERSYGNIRYTPFSGLSTYWSGNWDQAIQDNGSQSRNTSNSYTVDWSPKLPRDLLGVQLPTDKMTVRTKASRTQRWSSSTPYQSSRTVTTGRTNTGDLSFSYYPMSNLTITSGLNVEMYYNKVEPGTSTDTINTTIRGGTSYRPYPKIDLSANYYRKDTMDRKTDLQRPKEVFDAHVSYQLFENGTITYDFENEVNKGEVLAGALNDLDLIKMTNGITFKWVIPQNNLVLNNIAFDISWKQVDYTDNKNTHNNFTANQLTFEGTLNF